MTHADLIAAIRERDHAALNDISKNKKLLNTADEAGVFPIQHAVVHGNLETLQILVGGGTSIHKRSLFKLIYTPQKWFPWMYPILKKDRPKVRFLLEKGAAKKLNVKRDNPLYYAVYYANDPEMVRLLLEFGADPNLMLYSGTMVLHHCKQVEIAKILIDEGGADPNAKGDKGQPIQTYLRNPVKPHEIELLHFYNEILSQNLSRRAYQDLEPMGAEAFWDYIDHARRYGKNDETWMMRELVSKLRDTSPANCIAFHKRFLLFDAALQNSDMATASYLMRGSREESEFRLFRAWVVTLGAKIYYQALADPDMLVFHQKRNNDRYVNYWNFDCENLWEAGPLAYSFASGKSDWEEVFCTKNIQDELGGRP